MAIKSESKIDHAFLRKKYAEEREKRLRADGHGQYLMGDKASLKHYIEDPNCPAHLLNRSPVNIQTQAVVVGGGFGGLLAATRLIQAGIKDIKILDKAGDFGGTWYWNRFPGLQCDIESYTYMPLLEEMDYLPTERFAKGDEILAYMQNIGKKFGLYEKSIFRAEVSECKWDKTQNVWIVSTKQGDTIQTKYVLFPGGLLDKPRFPKIPGIESFKGHSFHTSRWDYEYTGGSLHGGLDGLKGKTVGIIGTGATGVQVIPHLANDSKQLYVFQRTPSTIDERANGPTDQEWAKTLTPGWQYRRRANFDNIFSGLAEGESAFDDKWTAFALRFSRTMSKNSVTSEADMLAVDDEKMEELRSRIDNLVHNKKTAEKLKPWYKYRCKRPCFHDQYLAAFNRPSVTLIDTNGAGIQAITEHGVVSGGKEYKLDCLIYATGFQLTTNWTSPKNLQVIGQNSQRLAEKWGEGTRTLHSLMTNEFPNVFFLQVAQAGFSPNFTHLLDEQAQHVAWIIRTCEDRKLATIQPTRKAEDDYVHMIEETGNMSQKYAADCTPGHYTNEGNKLDLKFIRGRPYSHGGRSFFQLLKEWRDKGDLTGMETTEATA